MRESAVENYLKARIERLGGLCLKYQQAANVGFPDRVVILPDGRHVWVELKAPGKKPRPLQLYRIDQLRALGVRVEVLDSLTAVDNFIASI